MLVFNSLEYGPRNAILMAPGLGLPPKLVYIQLAVMNGSMGFRRKREKYVETSTEISSHPNVFNARRLGPGFDGALQWGRLGNYGRCLYEPLRNIGQRRNPNSIDL